MASRFLKLGKLKNIFSSPAPTMIATDAKYQNPTSKRRIEGPQLFIIKLLCNVGPLTSNEIWSQFQRQTEISKHQDKQLPQYFKSKNHLKQKVLAWMISNQKIKTKGYNRVGKIHLGWEINETKAFKNIHPDVIQQLKQAIKDYKEREALRKKQQEQEALNKKI